MCNPLFKNTLNGDIYELRIGYPEFHVSFLFPIYYVTLLFLQTHLPRVHLACSFTLKSQNVAEMVLDDLLCNYIYENAAFFIQGLVHLFMANVR